MASFVSTVVGGIVGWAALFAGLPGWAFATGIVTTWTLLAITARTARQFVMMSGFSFAFLLLTWPPLWLAVGYTRYLITGEALGN
ncbi:MAG: hypothetical protein QOI03_1601 [Solirubrobacteraceae bacterium]|nr:hypothetical protein [Solirubrobacteraceae bacterium]